MAERPGFFERMFASGSGKPPDSNKALLPKKETEGYLQHPTEFLVREPSEMEREERKEARRRELAEWTADLERRLAIPEGRVKTLKLEIGGKTAEQYETELTEAGFIIDTFTKEILAKAELSKKHGETDIIRLTVADLGFPKRPTFPKILNRAKELGLDLCPPDVGPELRLSMKDQPLGDAFLVVMEPIIDSDDRDRSYRFSVGASANGRWLSYHEATHPDPDTAVWELDTTLAFARREP